jgi:hypothetical protein
MFWRRRKERELADAREEALRWYDRLGGQIANLPSGNEAAVKQAMVDAGERYNAAGAQLDRADSPKQYQLARESALEGLAYIRAARTAMGLDPGPELPPLAGQRGVGTITQDREVDVEGHNYKASPRPNSDTPYYYPGGRVQGRPVPGGWYSEPWWKGALASGAGVFGGLLLFDALSGGFNNGGFDQGYAQGYDQGYDQGNDQGDNNGAQNGDGDGGDTGADYDASGDYGGDYGGGDFGGGDFGGGDFGGGDFGGGDFGGDF